MKRRMKTLTIVMFLAINGLAFSSNLIGLSEPVAPEPGGKWYMDEVCLPGEEGLWCQLVIHGDDCTKDVPCASPTAPN